ncbi:ribosome maturation factor RimM [Jonesia quinghaiensis]|uniref:ribosome maturation factor RimM n=1 Tax=Jonesia quinghaiensis TaxID=262806 RepID=UPI0004258699|nr:ribosome maturation factor RimM [Jonesia quinghaiensis]
MQLRIGTLGKAHGLKGEVSVIVRTDNPEERLAVGEVLATEPQERGPLTVVTSRRAQGRWYVRFAGIDGRTAAENLRGTELVVDIDSSDEEDAWYIHELTGLEVRNLDGDVVGTVVDLEHFPAQDALVLKEVGGERVYLPFITKFVPVVDIAGGFITIDPPGGLLSTDSARLVVVQDSEGSVDHAEQDDAEERDENS